MKQGYKASVQEAVAGKENFREVLYTGEKLQLVAMTIKPGDDIGAEVHEGHDQFFHFVSGAGEVMIDETTHAVAAGDMVIVPSAANHNVTNVSETEALVLYTMYAPPEHQDKVVHVTKEEAEADDEHFDGVTTE